MPNYDYQCEAGHRSEHRFRISDRPETVPCPTCGLDAIFGIFQVPAMPTMIVVDYPGSKKFKAGYTMSHGDKRGTRIQTGYGGKVTPRDEGPPPDPSGAIWQNPLAD